MQPILVWLFGAVSTIACLVAVTAKRPVRSVQAFLLILLCSSVTVLLLNGTLLAFEIFLVCLGSSLAIRLLVIKRGKMKLGPPGRARINITRLLAFFAAIWFAPCFVGHCLAIQLQVTHCPNPPPGFLLAYG